MEVVEEGRGPKVLKSKSPKVSRSKGPEDQDISNSNSNTTLTLKKFHHVYNVLDRNIKIMVHFTVFPIIIITSLGNTCLG